MDPVEVKRRMKHVQTIYDALHEFIEKIAQKSINSTLETIAMKNKIKLGAETATFIFEGQLYPKSYEYNPHKEIPNKMLDSSFYTEVYDTLHNAIFTDVIQKVKLSNGIAAILQGIDCFEDIKKIIPIAQHLDLSSVDPEEYNFEDPMTEEELNTFKKTHKETLDTLKRIAVANLIGG